MRSRKNQIGLRSYPADKGSGLSGEKRQRSLAFDDSTASQQTHRRTSHHDSHLDSHHDSHQYEHHRTQIEVTHEQKLWLACSFPNIALDAIVGLKTDARYTKYLYQPTVVYDATDRHGIILALNQHAETQGIHTRMSLGVALSICNPLNALAQDIDAEALHLKLLASRASKISSAVSIRQHSLIMEIGGSIKLFGGFDALIQQARQRIGNGASTMFVGCAPTPAAAVLLSRYDDGIFVLTHDKLRPTISLLPIGSLWLDAKLELRLKGMGIEQIGDLLRLPRDGLARRATPRLLLKLDKILGHEPDLPIPYNHPSRFKQTRDSEHRIDGLSEILVNAKILLDDLTRALTRSDASINELQWIFYYEDSDPTTVLIELSESSRDNLFLYELTASRLEQTTLLDSVVSICLCSSEYIENRPTALSLFPETQEIELDNTLIDRLRARLGNHAVQGLELFEEHRPEYAAHGVSLGNKEATSSALQIDNSGGMMLPLPLRPLWLLTTPRKLPVIDGQPVLDGPLRIAANQERIESGWWETHSVRRDYYVAVDITHLRVWIYRDLRSPNDWYLHGIFG